jgi:hypothetical protein
MKTLYIHIGLPKTGTTLIQRWLSLNQTILADERIWVPTKTIYAHRLAVEYITDVRRSARSDVIHIKNTPLQAVRSELMAAVQNPYFTSGILSSEYFYECPPKNVESLREIIGNTNVLIVLFLRRQDRLIESGYNQEVKAMGEVNPLGRPQYSEKLDWLKLFESWTNVFGHSNIRAINYDLVASQDELLPAFFDAVDIHPDLAKKGRSDSSDAENRSLPANLLEFKRIANKLGNLDLERWINRAIGAGVGGPQFRLSPDIARLHLSFYAEGNRQLASRLKMSNSDELFPTSDLGGEPNGVDYTHRLPIETLAQLLALHIRQVEDWQAALTKKLVELDLKIQGITSVSKTPP